MTTMHVDTLIEAAGWWSYIVVFAMTAGETGAFIGLLLPGETVILLASAIAGRGDLNVLVLAAVVVAGGMTGDTLGYALGRRWKRRPNTRSAGRTFLPCGNGVRRKAALAIRAPSSPHTPVSRHIRHVAEKYRQTAAHVPPSRMDDRMHAQ
ncbi:DedA family protein [Streptomyces sp. NPDC101152]|uniref:DedA family protein n=1 Tax=Streptomyces sp. NPDC101152 TaxID=3366116 RepID=UPI0037FECC77